MPFEAGELPSELPGGVMLLADRVCHRAMLRRSFAGAMQKVRNAIVKAVRTPGLRCRTSARRRRRWRRPAIRIQGRRILACAALLR
eukprot:427073-Pleurochrysis_carterae.AAC.2